MGSKKVTITISEALCISLKLLERLRTLRNLQNNVSRKEDYYLSGDTKRVVMPLYDVNKVDKLITEIEVFLLQVDMAVKRSNAITTIEIDVPGGDINTLFRPIEQ